MLPAQFRESRLDPREYRGLSELGEYPLCLGQMLNGKPTLFLGLAQQTENHFRFTNVKTIGVVLRSLQGLRHQGAKMP